MIELRNFINGQLMAPSSGKYLDSYNPAIGEVIAKVPLSNNDDLKNAVKAANKAFPGWSRMPIAERSRVLLSIADKIEEAIPELAEAESMDNGKPIRLATKVDIPRSAANFRFFANAIVNHASESHIMEGEAVNYTRRAPLGVVGCISPWNLPLYLFTWKIAPALATGNCVIAKPSEVTPYTAYLLSKIIKDSDLPAGVLNILHGNGGEIGQSIVSHPEIKAISFTGGTSTGKTIGKAAAEQFKKVSLELGGKNPVIIFDDCDFDKAVETSVRSAFTNQGEICLCGSRILIHEKLYEPFKKAFLQKVKELKVGQPSTDVDLGAIVSYNHLEKIKSYVQIAKDEGDQILCGGNQILLGGGYYFEPTVIETTRMDCRINQEEVFGPVVSLTKFSNDEEALEMANATSYGLAAVIWTENLKRAHLIAHQLQSGIVWVNCWMVRDLRTPFGGMKASGVGREGGSEALRFFTEPQNICISLK